MRLKKLIVNVINTEKRIAVIEDGQVVELKVQQPSEKEHVGNIYSGRITDVKQGMQAAFVDIGTDKNGFIHRDHLLSYLQSPQPNEEKNKKSISSFASEGQEILVQVVKEGVGGKGPRLTGMIEVPGSYLVYLPHGKYIAVSRKMKSEAEREEWRIFGQQVCQSDEGLIVRTACETASKTVVLEELDRLRKNYQQITRLQKQKKPPSLLHETDILVEKLLQEIPSDQIEEIIVDDFNVHKSLKENYPSIRIERYQGKENIFSFYKIEHEIERALKRIVWLKSGAYIIIDKTEACTVIDVNTGKFQGKSNSRETAVVTNIEAAKEISRQLRLRDLGGIILIDFIDMKSESDRQKVIKAFYETSRNDRNTTKVLGFTQLGILEVTRKKTRQSLAETLLSTCSSCDGKGMIFSMKSLAFQLERELFELQGSIHEAVWVETSREIKAVVEGEGIAHLKRLEERLGLSVFFTVSEHRKHDYEIRHIGSEDEVKKRIGL